MARSVSGRSSVADLVDAPAASPAVYTYLTMIVGPQAGATFLLRADAETTLGRDDTCAIAVADPLCSRTHAVILQQDGAWRIRDANSRNGTYVNDRNQAESELCDGHTIRIGSTEFSFHQSEQPPTAGSPLEDSQSETIIRDTSVGDAMAGAAAIAAIRDSDQAEDLLLLYQLSISLLSCTEAIEVVRIALELLQGRTGASVAGFLWADDEGRPKSKSIGGDSTTPKVSLSDSLTRLVFDEGHAVWIANQQSTPAAGGLQNYADALCVPLVNRGNVLGAMHIYLDQGRFRQSHFDFAISVANIASVALVRARREESLEVDLKRLQDESPGYHELVGRSAPMQELRDKIGRLAKASGCVLVRGESGAGKELVARAIHRASPRADRPMLSVNCAAIPADLMESQLFGHKAGSFTGADRDHQGFFQQADLGTLFLDEVGELTLLGQSKLLRILEGHPFLPVGATAEVQVDVRVIAATNRDLLAYVREKKFREDLYYRLSVFEVVIPPLRERGPDIELLVDYFLDHYRRQHGRPELRLSDDARRKMLAYSWPGNVRQLRNVIDSAVVLASGTRIEARDLGLRDVGDGELDTLRIEDWERKLIAEALRRTNGNVPEAAKLLGIGRATLYRKIDEYGVAR